MTDPKSTNDIRMIASEVTHQQAEVCEAKRTNLESQLASNAEAIAALTLTVNTLVTNVAVLKGHPGAWAAIGAAVPVVLALALWWFSK